MSRDHDDQVKVGLAVDDVKASELDRLIANLHQELLQLDVDDVIRLREGPPRPGFRIAEIVALGPLIVAVDKIADGLSVVVRTMHGWVWHKPDRKIRLEIDGDVLELSGATVEQQQQLADESLALHHAR